MADPIPFYAAPIPAGGEMPAGAIPVRVYGLDTNEGLPEVVGEGLMVLATDAGKAVWHTAAGPLQALLAGIEYGTPGQVLAMNATGDGLEWVTP